MTTKTTTSEYLLLFRGTLWPKDLSPEEIQNAIAKFTSWFERLKTEGKVKSGRPLEHHGKIVTGSNTVMDGPFSESKEAIAGFFIIQADSLEEAVQIAKNCPSLDNGQTVEVRAIASEAADFRLRGKRRLVEKVPLSKLVPALAGRVILHPTCTVKPYNLIEYGFVPVIRSHRDDRRRYP